MVDCNDAVLYLTILLLEMLMSMMNQKKIVNTFALFVLPDWKDRAEGRAVPNPTSVSNPQSKLTQTQLNFTINQKASLGDTEEPFGVDSYDTSEKDFVARPDSYCHQWSGKSVEEATSPFKNSSTSTSPTREEVSSWCNPLITMITKTTIST